MILLLLYLAIAHIFDIVYLSSFFCHYFVVHQYSMYPLRANLIKPRDPAPVSCLIPHTRYSENPSRDEVMASWGLSEGWRLRTLWRLRLSEDVGCCCDGDSGCGYQRMAAVVVGECRLLM